MRHEWTVRVINPEDDTMPTTRLPWVWTEQLQHMGLVRVLDEPRSPHVLAYQVLEFSCPHPGIDTRSWADNEAARMTSFGINAVAAPKWRDR